MDPQAFWWAAWIVAGMFGAALVAKGLGASIVYAIGLLLVYPDQTKGGLLVLFYIPAMLIAAFRD